MYEHLGKCSRKNIPCQLSWPWNPKKIRLSLYLFTLSRLFSIDFHPSKESFTGWCLTPTLLLICSSFSRENGHIFLICSSLSTAQFKNSFPKNPALQVTTDQLIKASPQTTWRIRWDPRTDTWWWWWKGWDLCCPILISGTYDHHGYSPLTLHRGMILHVGESQVCMIKQPWLFLPSIQVLGAHPPSVPPFQSCLNPHGRVKFLNALPLASINRSWSSRAWYGYNIRCIVRNQNHQVSTKWALTSYKL